MSIRSKISCVIEAPFWVIGTVLMVAGFIVWLIPVILRGLIAGDWEGLWEYKWK